MWSQAQQDILRAEGRTILAVGAVGSGKTHAAIRAFVRHAIDSRHGPPCLHLVCGRSPIQLAQTVRLHIEQEIGEIGLAASAIAREMGLEEPDPFPSPRWNGSERMIRWLGHRFAFLAYTHVDSEARFRGVDARTGLLEEAALCSEQFWDWLQTRLRLPNARLYATANPEGPHHWLKRRIDDGRIDSHHVLRMEDNPALDPEVRRQIERQYLPGTAFHSRAIEGRWAAASGLIFAPESWTVGTAPQDGTHSGAFAGIDFGSTNNTAVVRIETRMNPLSWWVSDVLVIDGSTENTVPPSEQARRIVEWSKSHPFERAWVDPSATPLISELRMIAPWQVVGANNDVSMGLAAIARRFASGELSLGARTEPLQDELLAYTWDTKLSDTPLKVDDHCVDAMRYVVMGLDRLPPLL